MISTAPPERAGAAAAISETSSELGGALGIAILGSIGTAVYRTAMVDAPEAARGTLGGALAVARQLPDGAELVAAARQAFIEAMPVTAAIKAVVTIAAAIVAIVLLRGLCAVGAHHTPRFLAPLGMTQELLLQSTPTLVR